MRTIALVLPFALAACQTDRSIIEAPTAAHEGVEVIETPQGETIETLPAIEADAPVDHYDLCLVRARHFHGLVRIPCDEIAREAAP